MEGIESRSCSNCTEKETRPIEKLPSDITEEYTPVNTGIFDGHKYMIFNNQTDWINAQVYCQSLGGHLATITSAEENSFIMSLLGDDGAYMLGMHRDYTGFDEWITGESVTYSNWAPGQPDNLSGTQTKCVLANYYDTGFGITPGFWDDGHESTSFYFICEIDKVPEDECEHGFGEWTIEKEATIFNEGIESRICSNCFTKETRTIAKIIVDINNNTDYGLVKFAVVNAKTQEPVPKAQIFIHTADSEGVTLTADDEGKLSQIMPAGENSVSVYADGYLVRNLTFVVTPGEQDLPLIGISSQPLVDANITTREMTYDEIVAAGIDVNDESNQHVYEYKIEFVFTPEIDTLSLIAYFNGLGGLIGFGGGGGYFGPGGPEGGDSGSGDGSGELGYTLHYHLNEGGAFYDWSHGWCKDVEVEKGEHVYLNYRPFRENADEFIFDAWYEDPEYTKKITHVDIEEHLTVVYGRWIPKNGYDGDEDKYKYKQRFGFSTMLSDGTPVEIYPVSEKFYLVIYGRAKWLKEMYNVQLVAINNSTTDTVENCFAELSLPAGLSLAKMTYGDQSFVQEIGHLDAAGGENSTKTVNWYVRGDSEGTYDVTAKMTGKLMPFEEEFSYEYTAQDPITVLAGSAMHMTIEAPGVTYYNDDYPIRITLENVSSKPIYNLNHAITGLEQYRVTKYSDGSEEKEIYVDTGFVGDISTDIFNPGDKMVIELTTNIMFESELYKYQFENLTGLVDNIEQIINGYKALGKGAKLLTGLGGFLDSASKGIKDVISSKTFTSTEQSKAYSKLASALSKLMAKIEKGDSKALAAYDKLNKSGLMKIIESMADSESFYNAKTALEVMKMADSINAIVESSEEDDSDEFDIFESIKTAIEAIPIRFVLQNVSVTTLEGSTTEIPYTIKIGDTNATRYFGVQNIGKYLYSLVIASAGEVDVPWYLQIFGAEDDPTGYEEAVEYIKATEKEIERISAHSATGLTTFRAWVERAGASLSSVDNENISDDFRLSCTNETASVDENGVLTFSGAGFIEIEPLNSNGGVLHIEMEEDGESREAIYVIETVEAHTCSGSEWYNVIEPDEEEKGYAAMLCDICDDVIDIKEVAACEEHSYGEFVIEKEFSDDSYGLKYKQCSVCGHKEYEFITESSDSEAESDSIALKEGSSLNIKESYINGVEAQTTVDELTAQFENKELVVKTADGKIMGDSEKVGTGCKVQLVDGGSVIDELIVIIRGDVNGDGLVNEADLTKLFAYIQGEEELADVYKQASYLNEDAKINVTDLVVLHNIVRK